MKTKIFVILLLIPSVAGAQNVSEKDSSGFLSSIPDIEIDSAENYNNSTGQSNEAQSNLSWIIVLSLIFIGVVMYSFEIDPKWIVILIGLAALFFSLSWLGLLPV